LNLKPFEHVFGTSNKIAGSWYLNAEFDMAASQIHHRVTTEIVS